MDKRPSSPTANDAGQPLKTRRIARACLQCRTRKQRCLPSIDDSSLQTPCKRCQQHAITCSFETDPIPGPNISPSPSQMAQIVVDIQRRIITHEARISELERQAQSPELEQQRNEGMSLPIGSRNVSYLSQPSQIVDNGRGDHSVNPPHSHETTSQSPGFSMDTLDLGPPIATLRSLGALSKDGTSRGSFVHSKIHSKTRTIRAKDYHSYDPVSRGILSLDDAGRAIKIFFDHCHSLAPVLDEKLRHSGLDLRVSSPTLFLAICSIGARFWGDENTESGTAGLHPNFFALITLLDSAVSRLLLRPSPSDVTLDSIRVLLLYAQWMPCSFEGEDGDTSRMWDSSHPPPRSRYNDISAWSVLGLAIRYAKFLGLDQAAVAPFQGPARPISEDQMSTLRVWHNMITCDCNLMLSSGLPSSLDPAPAASIARVFSSHPTAQRPADLRVTALVELAIIAHRATRSSGDSTARQLDALCLRKANNEMDEWERSWVSRLRHTDSQHNQLPFNSVRWYRLALNSASLGPFLSSSKRSQRQPLQVRLLQSLEISLTAASQMLMSLSSYGADHVWSLESQNIATFPGGSFPADAAALKRLYYAVDSTWISHTFAVTFLVLCYVKGIVDDELQICSLTPVGSQRTAPLLPCASSLIARLVQLAVDIFDGICHSPTFHPARDFQAIVHDASSLIIAPVNLDWQNGQELDNSAMQSLLDFMNDSGLEWPGSHYDSRAEYTAGWEVDEMLGH